LRCLPMSLSQPLRTFLAFTALNVALWYHHQPRVRLRLRPPPLGEAESFNERSDPHSPCTLMITSPGAPLWVRLKDVH